jgi:hypothetical protein
MYPVKKKTFGVCNCIEKSFTHVQSRRPQTGPSRVAKGSLNGEEIITKYEYEIIV